MKRLPYLTAILLTGGALTAPAHAVVNSDLDARDSILEQMLTLSGGFEMGDGEFRVLSNTKTDKVYRICVRTSRQTVPVKVMFDDKTAEVVPGNCIDVEGMKVSVMPAAKLEKDAVLIGHFHNVTR